MPLPQQAKLLTALQRRTIRRVGGSEDISLDLRLICATNELLYDRVQQPGDFREDLLYRINTVEIRVPPLRDRVGDVALLAEHFLAHYAEKYRKPRPELSAAALEKLERYAWPGNVRELRHAIERAVILTEEPVLDPESFVFSASAVTSQSSTEINTLDENERVFIEQALLQKHQGNVTQTAKALGITRTALYRRLDKYGL